MTKVKRPGKGCFARDLEKYARLLGWTERQGKHSFWFKDDKCIALPRSERQPVAYGTYIKIIKILEAT